MRRLVDDRKELKTTNVSDDTKKTQCLLHFWSYHALGCMLTH